MQVNRADVNNLLMQMRELKAQAGGMSNVQPRSDVEAAVGGTSKVKAPDFSDMFANAVDKVNATQKHSSALAKAYEQGDPSVTLSQVMVASQKSSVAFQATTQVRNKLVEAYKDIMNMPI